MEQVHTAHLLCTDIHLNPSIALLDNQTPGLYKQEQQPLGGCIDTNVVPIVGQLDSLSRALYMMIEVLLLV